MKQAGFDVEIDSWVGIAAPRGLPPDVLAALEAAALRAVKSPAYQDKLRRLGVDRAGMDARHYALTSSLSGDPVEVVALTRNPLAATVPKGVGVAAVDFDMPSGLGTALAGVDKLFLAHGTSPLQVADEAALIDAAVGSGMTHIVKLSSPGPATRLNPLAWHMQIEAHLSRQPVASTVLRPSALADNLRRFGPQVAAARWASAAGRNGRVNFIDTRDIAAAARNALLDKVDSSSQRAVVRRNNADRRGSVGQGPAKPRCVAR